MNKESYLHSRTYSSRNKILSPHFKKIVTFNSLENQEKKLYHIISKFLNNNEVIYPLSQLTEFFENYSTEELSWKKCFITLCLFLDHQTIRNFSLQSEPKQQNLSDLTEFSSKKSEEVLKNTSDEKKSLKLNNKRSNMVTKDKENSNPEKRRRNDQFEELHIEIHNELLYIYILNKFENLKNLYFQTFKKISNETEISEDAITMEKTFYDLIGLKYTYYNNTFFNNSSFKMRKLMQLNRSLSQDIEIFDHINLWCAQMISKRESVSNTINFNIDNNLRSILCLSYDLSDKEIMIKCDNLLKWLFLPIEDNSDSEVFKTYKRLKEAKIKCESEYKVKSDDIDTNKRNEQLFSAKSNFQKLVIEFVLSRHSEQKQKHYNPFWTLGINPRKFKINEISLIKKKLLLLTHPDKISEKNMKEKANEAYFIIQESLELINKLFKTNCNIIKSLPKGPELSYDFDLYFEKYLQRQKIPPEIIEINATIIEVNGKETIQLPPGIKISVKFRETVINANFKIYLTLPFIGINTMIEKNQLMNHVFNTYLIEASNELDREDIITKLSGDCVCVEISDLLLSGYPGVTELSYYIGVQVIYQGSFFKTTWKRVRTKLPTEREIIRGFSKNGIKRYLELYCRTWGNDRKCVQNMLSAAKLWNIIDNTPRKAELVKVLIKLMENSYKTSLLHLHNL